MPSTTEHQAPRWASKLGRNFIYSQVGGVVALTLTNFLEVMKVRKIVDSYQCQPSHFKLKTRGGFLAHLAHLAEVCRNSSGQTSVSLDRPKSSPWSSPSKLLTNAKINKYFFQNEACSHCLPKGNLLNLYRHLISKEGMFKVFFGGLQSAMMSHLVRVGIFFPIREALVDLFKSNSTYESDSFASILSSGLARTVSTVVSFPLDVKKIDHQLNNPNSPSFFGKEKIGWRRYIPTFLQFYQKELFNTLFFWIIYEQVKTSLKKPNTESETLVNIQSAAIAGALSGLLSHPNDYLQTITNLIRNKQGNVSSWQLLRSLHSSGQLTNIASGASLRTTRAFTINILFFSIFEGLKSREASK